MSTYQYLLGDKILIIILKVLPLNNDLKEEILDKIIEDLLMDFFVQGSQFSDLSLADDNWELDIEGYWLLIYL